MKASTERPSSPAPVRVEPVPGVTIQSIAAILFGMLLMVVVLVFGETIEGNGWHYSMHAIAIPAAVVFLGLCGLAVILYWLFGIRLLTRGEMVCVFFSLLMAAPIMGLGFWTNFIWLSSTFAVQGDFKKLDMVSDRLWPHGPNLLAGVLENPDAESVRTHGDVQWIETEYEAGVRARIPVLRSAEPDGVTWLRIKAPIEKDGRPFLTVDQRYLLSVLARGRDLGPDAMCYGRVYCDEAEAFDLEAFQSRPGNEISAVHRTGFERIGVYGIEFPSKIKNHAYIELRLVGDGTVEFADAKLLCVDAFESLFRGRRTVSRSEYESMRASERGAYVMRPNRLLSLPGLAYLAAGFIPVRDWASPVLGWLSFILLFLTATFSMALILRRQWIKSERYPMPVAQIPMAFLGIAHPECADGAPPPIWRNRVMWLGFGLCLFWSLMRCWHAYNSNVPNMNIDVPLKPYFDDPGWGQMWNYTSFSISAVALSLAVFMELNVLMSLVIGFFLFISLHWLGEANGWTIGNAGKYGMGVYPYATEQLVSAYLTYGILVLFFTRKYLWRTIKQAVKGGARLEQGVEDAERSEDELEPFSYRTAYSLLILSLVGALLWARWAEIEARAMLVLFGAMVLFGVVAMKLRAECGAPLGWIGTGTRLLVPLAGGVAFLGARASMFSTWTSLGMALLFALPGLQLEFIEVARRARVVPRHVVYCVLFSACGGMFLGGWFFLSSMYGIGADTSGQTYWFKARPWEFFADDEFLQAADAKLKTSVEASGGEDGGIDPAIWGYVGAAVATAVVTMLRQISPGFWFHPIGVVLAATANGSGMLLYWSFNLWGSLLAAWAIRLTVLKLGGAAAVRDKLFPFFTGVFAGAISGEVVFFCINAYYYFFEPAAARASVVL